MSEHLTVHNPGPPIDTRSAKNVWAAPGSIAAFNRGRLRLAARRRPRTVLAVLQHWLAEAESKNTPI